jgi:hypothetical protein
MMRDIRSVYVLVVFLLMIGCDKDDDDPIAARSRDIRIEVTGNFVGNLSATYVNATGDGSSETIASLPFTKNIKYVKTVPSMGITVAGINGTAGQTIMLKVIAGGTLISHDPATADADGRIVVTAPSYIF